MKEQVYNKIVVYYFSGTGNAKNTALWVGNEVKKAGIEFEIFNITKIKNHEIPIPTSKTLIGFISPTHGFHFPEIMRKFIKAFPKSENCDAFVMNTRAGVRFQKRTIRGLSGVLHYWSSIVLRLKGYKIVGLFPVDLPSNWISIHPAIEKKGTEIIYNHMEPKVRQFAKDLISGKRNFKAFSISEIILDIIVSPIAILYMLFGKYFFSKSFIASSKCNMCEICEKTCPVQAIKKVDKRMFWTYKCESCMKCMNVCPEKAIETAHGFMIGLWIISSIIVDFLISYTLKFHVFENWQWLRNESVVFLIDSIAIFLFLFIGYRLMHWLMRFKIFERIFVLTSLTNYKFWCRYKSPKTWMNK